jgi:hypothetical protein
MASSVADDAATEMTVELRLRNWIRTPTSKMSANRRREKRIVRISWVGAKVVIEN